MSRRQSREDALQILYQLELNQPLTPQAGMKHFSEHFNPDGRAGVDPFTQKLVLGVTEHLKAIDETIREAAENWRPERMASVDRNILRLGVYELMWCQEVPATVTINEMIELAKAFGSDTSAAFTNGILDKVRLSHPRADKAP
jgi:transcription antitermination protein NusB